MWYCVCYAVRQSMFPLNTSSKTDNILLFIFYKSHSKLVAVVQE